VVLRGLHRSDPNCHPPVKRRSSAMVYPFQTLSQTAGEDVSQSSGN
jgi:hypothetical protein